ncbi:ImmA/IrrE family metallo-endopeptidase [Rothia mucilaginosa]|uniref:ImmA/IrrE family metallo-endopeptidase n=1 Tax=Rothia mucilaginosa TaxID=43675 RepID=UPI0028DB1CB8|nr:ImmA/IrrE family metallo-endopeptidase [Rothia mucilaginosa]
MTSVNAYDPDAHAASLGIRIIDAKTPAGTLALWDEQTRTIITTPGLLYRQRRCVLAHELAHAVNGDEHSLLDDVASTKRERRADTIAAGWLLQPQAVRTALAVAPDSLPAAAAELEVTERILSAWLWEHSKRGGLDS